jgi:hypothetical protein
VDRIRGEVVATGRLTAEDPLQAGDDVTVGAVVALVEELVWTNGEPRLILAPRSRR